jgi:hypothetical protein
VFPVTYELDLMLFERDSVFKDLVSCPVRKVQDNQMGLKLNGTHSFWLMLMM